MKTTDGHEAKLNDYYHLENGQQVILEGCALSEGTLKPAYLVTPFYEGEAMSASGSGGMHHEINTPYEHEGETTLVFSIFKDPPLGKIDEKYKAGLSKIESLAVSFGEMKKHLDKLSSEKSVIERHIIELSKACENSKKCDLQARTMLDSTTELVNRKRSELSDLEDSIGDFIGTEKETSISKTELQSLRKRDFELQCLENGGVDNWEWYSESLKEFNERYPEG